MFERTLQSAVRYLATVPKHVVPITDLWSAVTQEARASKIEQCALPDFAALLEADPRFEILENGFDPDDIDVESFDSERRELFILGFSPSCLVSLRLELDGEDGEEMPSIVHKHLSETKPSRPVNRSGPARPQAPRTRHVRGSSASVRPKKKGARRRRS